MKDPLGRIVDYRRRTSLPLTIRGSAWCMLELKQLTPPAAESVTTRSVPYLVTRQADSLEGGHGFGGVRQRLPNTRSHQLEIGAKLGAQKFLNCLSVRSGRLRRGGHRARTHHRPPY